MKKFVFITGAIAIALIPIVKLFKVFHFSGANIILMIETIVFSCMFIPFLAKYVYDKIK